MGKRSRKQNRAAAPVDMLERSRNGLCLRCGKSRTSGVPEHLRDRWQGVWCWGCTALGHARMRGSRPAVVTYDELAAVDAALTERDAE